MLSEIGSKFRFPYRREMRNWTIKSWCSERERWICGIVDGPFTGQEAYFLRSHVDRLVDAQSIAQNMPVGKVGLGAEAHVHR